MAVTPPKPPYETLQSNPPPAELAQVKGYAHCDCFEPLATDPVRWRELAFHDDDVHSDAADASSPEYRQLCELVKLTAERGLATFSPRKDLGWSTWSRVRRLPPTIGQMDRVTHLELYGSFLVAIPREIMGMTALVEFDPYTSYSLHWFPYEITRCPALKESRISTRALYGNYKFRPPFPQLPNESVDQRFCSLCDAPLAQGQAIQCWISLRVATDIMPLLVNACSRACLARLPPPYKGEIDHAHTGGSGTPPAPTRW